ncbi:podocalyxin-like protein 2 [Mauremys reevesii]|uniref:podocalyxin-like protein 2 n=1 Tax=Mauremys reevesii TaxID=260615 RepID=UPI00193F8C55|nr:podocalyxin-like protein 2 [Mauremys reevesii]
MKLRLRQALAVLLAWGTLCICLVSSEEPTAEGLTSTSLVEFTMMSHLELLDSSEQSNLEATEPDPVLSALHASAGSGFASEENEESKILQPPQYFWEDGGELNDSSLDLGPATDYSFPVTSHKALPKGNRTQVKDNWETTPLQPSSDSMEPDPHIPFTSALEEEEGLLPINQSKGGQQSSQTQWPKDISSEAAGQEDSLFSLLFSTASSRLGVVTEAAVESQEEDSVPEHTSSGFDLGSSMGPSLLPVSSILSVTAAGSQGVTEHAIQVTSENIGATVGVGVELAGTVATAESTQTLVGAGVETTELPVRGELIEPSVREEGEQVGPTVLTGMEQTEEAPEVTSPGGSPQNPKIVSGSGDGPANASASAASLDRSDEPAATPARNGMKLATETVAAGRSFVPQTGDTPLDVLSTGLPWNSAQVICKDWSNLAGKNYIILNMSDNIDCEEFRLEKGPQLLALVEDAFSRQTDGLQAQWLISLSKPNENDKHLLMTLAGEQGVVPTKDVLMALGYVQRSLAEIGIQNYSTTTSCQSGPSQTRSDYGKLFVVLVIIGSICAIIIIMGLIYNCWQRRLPKMKNMSHGEELRFVENGCHDNPTLDVASDSQSEMQEKKTSVNGGGAINGPDGWDVLITKRASEDADVFEEDTHL